MRSTSPLLLTLAALLLLAVAFVAWIKVGSPLDPKAVLVAPLDSGCDLREGSCEAAFPDGSRVAFEIRPRHIPPLQKLKLSVRTEGIDVQGVEVDFSGADMNMGFNRVSLESIGPGEHRGVGVLPVCVRARMTWEAKVLLYTDAGLLAAPFRFDTYLPGRGPSALSKKETSSEPQLP